MIIFVFTQYSEKEFNKLPKNVRARILDKLRELKRHDDIFTVLKRLHNLEPATHRLRVGNYRLILELKSQTAGGKAELWILDIGDRKDIYR